MAIKSIETSDLITHTDVVRNFTLGVVTSQVVDYTTTKDAKRASACMRAWLREHARDDEVLVIQRENDVILYKPSRKRVRAWMQY